MIKMIFRIILWIISIVCVIIAIQYLFNGGIEAYRADIKDFGFWGFVKEFFKSIWTGFKDTVGMK